MKIRLPPLTSPRIKSEHLNGWARREINPLAWEKQFICLYKKKKSRLTFTAMGGIVQDFTFPISGLRLENSTIYVVCEPPS